MFLLRFVNSTLEARRPTGILELVDLSLEKKYHPPEQVESRVNHLSNGHLQNGSIMSTVSYGNGNGTHMSTKSEKGNNGATPIMNPVMAKPRRPSMEDLPADIYMEPLCPLVLRSPDGKQMPVYVLEKDIASSRDQDSDSEWSFWGLAQGECPDTSRLTTISKITLASKLASVLADGGISTRVQHPLEMTEEDQDRDSDSGSESESESESVSDRETTTMDTVAEKSCEEVGLPNNDEGFERILQHLERIEGSVKDLKARIDDAKLRIEQSGQEWGALPRNAAEPDCDQAKTLPSLSPSLLSPVMEKMGRVASPELPYSWNKKLNNANLPQVAVKESEPVMEERDLRYSPPMVESDVQDVLSFRLWEEDASEPAPKPKRRSRRGSVSRGLEELDLETALDLVADEYAKSKDLKLPLPNSRLRRFRVRNSWDSVGKDDGNADAAAAAAVAASTESVKSATKKLSPPNFDALLNLKTFDLCSRRVAPKVDVEVDAKGDVESQDFNPSPCSFTCGLSPTSLFSDDQEPFQMSVSIDENMFLKSFQPSSGVHGGSRRKSPRSVLSPKDEDPDEISHSTSDCSETQEEDRQQINAANACAYLYNDESSDLESPMKVRSMDRAAHRPFPTFTYNVGNEMGETSSSEEDQDESARDDTSTTLGDVSVADLGDLEFFQEAAKLNQWEPWLVKDGDGVLDDSDLEFLLSPDLKIKDITTSMIAELSKGKTSPLHAREQQLIPRSASKEVNSKMVEQKPSVRDSPRRPKSWVPYVTGELRGSDASPVRSPARAGSRRHGNAPEVFVTRLPRAAGGEKTIPQTRPPKRSVNFAADLVKEIPPSPGPSLDKKPAPPALNPRAKPNVKRHDYDEHVISPSLKTWETEEEGPSIMTSRRRWRQNREENGTNSPGGSSRGGSSSWDARSGSRRQRVAQVVPCAGRLFSWPQKLSSKVRRGRAPMESDEESFAGDWTFGVSARRDAEQVRRIVKGSQKRYSNLSVAEIMKEDFGK